MPIGSEGGSVQRPFIEYAQEVGWTYLEPAKASELRCGENGLLLYEIFKQQACAMNPGWLTDEMAENLAARLERVRPNIEGNQDAWLYLRGQKTMFDPDAKRERNVTLLDVYDPSNNVFHITQELRFDNGGGQPNRFDITLFVNGIPVLLTEAKAPHVQDAMSMALDQIERYHRESPEFVALTQVYAATHLIRFLYGPTWNLSARARLNWKDETAGDYETLVKHFLAPPRTVRVLNDYVKFVRKEDELSKIVLAPHQMRAAERSIGRAREQKTRGLIWHTQGSGKTHTMMVIAKRLTEEPAFENPTVLLIVDRLELLDQLSKNLDAIGCFYKIGEGIRHLQGMLESDERGIILTMIHRFDEMPANMSARSNIVVLIDEAHRTMGGTLGSYLMGAFPNATFLGFTGTPIDKTAYGKGTFKTFGTDDEKGYLDKYSIRESIEDGTTVPLHYTLAPNDLRVDRETLEREFLDMVVIQGVAVDMQQIDRVLERAVTLRTMLKKPERIERVAAFVGEHFTLNVDPMGYKAFLVAVDREACAHYKVALDEHLPSEWSEVVYSDSNSDSELMKRFHISEEREKQIRKEFRKPDALPKILIVTEKLLTGYDAEILYCMYLDKPMRDHVLLQTIARINRPFVDEHKRKTCGLVLDFVGIFENLEKALAFDSADVSGVIDDIGVLEELFASEMQLGRDRYLSLCAGLKGDKEVEAILDYFLDEDNRTEFYQYIYRLQDVFEILAPSAFLRPFLAEYDELIRVYLIVKEAYDPGTPTDRELLRKTIDLVHKHTEAGEISPPLEVVPLDENALDQLSGSSKPDIIKVFNLVKTIEEEVRLHEATEPYLGSIGELAQVVVERFQQRQIETEEALKQLRELFRDIMRARKASKEEGLGRLAFAVFWELQRLGIPTAKDLALNVDKVFQESPHWRTSTAQYQQARTRLYAMLLQGGLKTDEVKTVVDQIIRVGERATDA
ncbi:HsdR family type I site-specific deoxyribonuclease [Fimbriimonadia bacterium ATM]|nr:MAG: HsdR family type I site-specific deoxyribonuclease [Armatimonadota bacterium]MBC6970279.1 HsdR family type I site-specific deoxyribonuclease [Armatimonadota bacterium]MCE7899541.1 HsdR family type I site-specific deoxyribonuclease [Armatimonadetes bacterium ATM1]MDL1927629.1 HsdR family type I site-specific deoxyribonuclease [Fimbriimonadia bacterium ATM]RIJ96443.1 MAG: deoxyribonuclease HsdR [Armatimonadota bacterium]